MVVRSFRDLPVGLSLACERCLIDLVLVVVLVLENRFFATAGALSRLRLQGYVLGRVIDPQPRFEYEDDDEYEND